MKSAKKGQVSWREKENKVGVRDEEVERGVTVRDRERVIQANGSRQRVGRKRIVYGKVHWQKEERMQEKEDTMQRQIARYVEEGKGKAHLPSLHPCLQPSEGEREWASQGVLRNAPAGAAVEFIPDLCVRSSLFARHCVSQAVAVRNFLWAGRDSSLRTRARGEIEQTRLCFFLDFFVPQAITIALRHRKKRERSGRTYIYSSYTLRNLMSVQREHLHLDFPMFSNSYERILHNRITALYLPRVDLTEEGLFRQRFHRFASLLFFYSHCYSY